MVKRMKEIQEYPPEQEENLKFPSEEFNQCFSQMEDYDETGLSLAKFAFSFYSAVATVSFAMGRYFYHEHKTRSIEIFLGFLLVLTFFFHMTYDYYDVRQNVPQHPFSWGNRAVNFHQRNYL